MGIVKWSFFVNVSLYLMGHTCAAPREDPSKWSNSTPLSFVGNWFIRLLPRHPGRLDGSVRRLIHQTNGVTDTFYGPTSVLFVDFLKFLSGPHRDRFQFSHSLCRTLFHPVHHSPVPQVRYRRLHRRPGNPWTPSNFGGKGRSTKTEVGRSGTDRSGDDFIPRRLGETRNPKHRTQGLLLTRVRPLFSSWTSSWIPVVKTSRLSTYQEE